MIRMGICCLALLFVLTVAGQTIIKGSFKSMPATDFRIVYNQSSLNDYKGETLATGKTDSGGGFLSTFLLPAENPVLLYMADRFFRLWAMPGTTLLMEENDAGQLNFSGKSALQNKFLYQSGIMQPFAAQLVTNGFEPEKHSAYIDSIENSRWALFNSYFKKDGVSGTFVSYCKGEVSYYSFFQKNQYPLRYIYMDKTLKKEAVLPPYYDFWNKVELLNDSCSSDFYQNGLRDYIEYLANKQLNNAVDDKEKFYPVYFRIQDSLLTHLPFTKQKQATESISFLIDYFDLPAFAEQQLKKYEDEFPLSPSVSLLTGKWQKKNTNAASVPVFALRDTAGKIFDISSLSGKVIYIDFWGSWCKPCLAQMANSAKLQQQFSNRDVAFLFIDFYDTKTKWLKTIRERKLSGIHVKAEAVDEKYFNEKFGIANGFPRYALIDKRGVLVTTSAPHPNDDATVLLIEKYLR